MSIVDRVDGVLGEVAGVGDDHRDRLADAADVAVGEHAERARSRPGRLAVDQVVVHEVVEVGGGVHGHDTGHRRRGASVSTDTMRAAGDVAADERDVQHARAARMSST